jgi:hypothetical protein
MLSRILLAVVPPGIISLNTSPDHGSTLALLVCFNSNPSLDSRRDILVAIEPTKNIQLLSNTNVAIPDNTHIGSITRRT